jgi:hypothetical protein
MTHILKRKLLLNMIKVPDPAKFVNAVKEGQNLDL